MRTLWARLVFIAAMWCSAWSVVLRNTPAWPTFCRIVRKLLKYHERLDIGGNLPTPGYMTIVREIVRADYITVSEASDIVGCLMEKLITRQGYAPDMVGTLIAGRAFEECKK